VDLGRYLEPEIELAPRVEIERRQREGLAETIDHALGHSPFLRDLWSAAGVEPGSIECLEDFTDRAPTFTQADATTWGQAHRDPFGGLLCMPLSEITFIGATSGTTGVPLALPQYDGNPRTVATSRDLWEEGLRPGETLVSLSPSYRMGFVHPGHEVGERLGVRTVRLEAGLGSARAVLEATRRYGPVAINIMSRPLLVELEDRAAALGVDLEPELRSYRGATFGGEPLDGTLKHRLEALFGRVRNHTGLGNTIAAVECREADGSHTWEDLVLVEVVDPDSGAPVPEGEPGELVVTTLAERATPLLRFRTRDLVRYTSERCGCGRTHGRVWTLGRVGDGVRAGDRTITPVSLLPVLAEVPETRDGVFQLVVGAGGLARVRAGRRPGGRSDGQVRADVAAALKRFLGLPVPVEVVDLDSIVRSGSRIKVQRIVREDR
jgi:phenylacetate-CoA ligase